MNEITIMPPGLPPGGIAVSIAGRGASKIFPRLHQCLPLLVRMETAFDGTKKNMTFAKGPPLTAAIHLLRQHPFYKQAVAHGGVVYKHMRHRAD